MFDKDGKLYLYYSRACYKHPVESEVADWAKAKGWFNEIEESWVYGVQLKPDFSGVIGEPVLLLRPPVSMKDKQAEWESRSVTSKEVNRRWTEGSVAFKKGNTYYMMYSANYFGGKNYAVGYATSKVRWVHLQKQQIIRFCKKMLSRAVLLQALVIIASHTLLMVKKCFAYIMEELLQPEINVWYLLIE